MTFLTLKHQTKHMSCIYYYYIDLLYRHWCFTEKYTTPKIHWKLHPWPEWLFSISSLVKITMTSFPAFSWVFMFGWWFVYIIKRTLHKKNITLFLPLEHKIHLFSPPCNILYICILCFQSAFASVKNSMTGFPGKGAQNYF